jgi:hypothetical protein
MAFITSGLVFMLFPGTLLGVWDLLQISGRERGGFTPKRRLVGRNWLLGRSGDRTNALLAASGFNLRQLLRYLKRMEIFLRFFLRAVLTASTV